MAKRAQGKFNDPDHNPCIKESDLSMQCLENELYDQSNCKIFFENYRNCKKFWAYVSRKRKSAGIEPYLPTKEERDKIVALREKGINVTSVKE